MTRRPPSSTRATTLLPYSTRFLSQVDVYRAQDVRVGMRPRGLGVRGLNLEGLGLAVCQRVGTSRQGDLVRALQAQGVAVVIDVDDALYCIDPDSGSFAAWNDRRATHWSNLEEARSEEHTSELQSLMRISYAVFCLKKKNQPPSTRRSQPPLC